MPTRLLCPWGFSRQEYWSGLSYPPPGDLPNPGIEPRSPTLQADSLPAEPLGKPKNTVVGSLSLLQAIFPTQESTWGLLHCRQILNQLSYLGSPSLCIPAYKYASVQFNSVQLLSRVQLFATPWITAYQASLSITNSQSLPKLRSIESVMPSSHVILCRPLLLLPPIPPSIRVFFSESVFTSGGRSIGVSASASVLPMNIQHWFPLGLTGLTSLLSKGLSRVFSNTTVQKHRFFGDQPSLWSSSHIHTWLLGKP